MIFPFFFWKIPTVCNKVAGSIVQGFRCVSTGFVLFVLVSFRMYKPLLVGFGLCSFVQVSFRMYRSLSVGFGLFSCVEVSFRMYRSLFGWFGLFSYVEVSFKQNCWVCFTGLLFRVFKSH